VHKVQQILFLSAFRNRMDEGKKGGKDEKGNPEPSSKWHALNCGKKKKEKRKKENVDKSVQNLFPFLFVKPDHRSRERRTKKGISSPPVYDGGRKKKEKRRRLLPIRLHSRAQSLPPCSRSLEGGGKSSTPSRGIVRQTGEEKKEGRKRNRSRPLLSHRQPLKKENRNASFPYNFSRPRKRREKGEKKVGTAASFSIVIAEYVATEEKN